MRTVLAVQAAGLPSGTLLFSDEEVEAEVEVFPRQEIRVRRTQAGDSVVYYAGGVHYEIRVPFRIARYDTLLKLNEIFELGDRMNVFPHYPEDVVTSYEVVLVNPDAFHERWRRGYPRANYSFTLEFREPRGAVCVPPAS